MQLRHGGRIELVLEALSQENVRYRVTLETASGCWTGSAEIEVSEGKIELGSDAEPRWLAEVAIAMLRAAWRAHRSPSKTPWPRRLTRWRPEPST